MFLVRIAGMDGYASYLTLAMAAQTSVCQDECPECNGPMDPSDPAVTFRYPSANPGSPDTYLVTVCGGCSAPVALRIATSMAEMQTPTVGDLPF